MTTLQSNCAALLPRLRTASPLIHQITNYVTANDCANAVLAIGASPIMADDIAEAADITALAQALVLNTGTLNQRSIDAMLQAGKMANQKNIPVILDPVGAGASPFRSHAITSLLAQIKVAVLRGNLSEIAFCADLAGCAKGVDVSAADEKLDAAKVAKTAAARYGCIAAITGPVDTVSDGTRIAQIYNGHPMLSKVTGTGCMTTALIACFCTVADPFCAAVTGISSMGIAGELAFEHAGKNGTGSFHIAIIDALSTLDAPSFYQKGKIYET